MGSADMAVNKILVVVVGAFVGSVAGQLAGTELTTQVPILRFLDSKNPDGSYTYGFESGDGTYKIETRQADGTVKGKYAYIDTNGVLRETSYGSSSERGFEPIIDGVAAPSPLDNNNIQNNYVEEARPVQRPVQAQRFSNFRANQVAESDVRIVNGRRAVLKKRLRVNPRPAQPVRPQVQQQFQREQFQISREEELRALEAEKRALSNLHRQRYNGVTGNVNPREQARSLHFQQQRQFQPQRQIQQQILPQQNAYDTHPYVTNYNSQDGSYSLSY